MGVAVVDFRMLVAAFAASIVLVSGCTSIAASREARTLATEGRYAAALAAIDRGLAISPENVELRRLRVIVREEASVRIIAAANAARLAGKPDAAEAAAKQLLELDPANGRAQALLVEIERDRRIAAAEQEAIAAVKAGQPGKALVLVEAALRDSPRSEALLRLQRDIELQARRRNDAAAGRMTDGGPVNLEFRDANVRMVLEALSRTTGVNFIVDKDVRADLQTTIFLKQARLEDALNVMMSSSQLAMRILNPTTVMIYPNTAEKAKEYQDLLIRGFYLANADAKQTASLLKTMLRLRDVFVDDKLNLVVVRDTPDAIRLAERLVAMHDLGEPEVMLEVEVLEVKSSRLLDLGIKYPDTFTLTPLSMSGGTSLTLDDLQNLNSSRIGVSTPSVTLNFKREVGDLNVLANPKIRARNRERAKVLIGDRLPVITSTATSTGFVSESIQYVDVGIKLEVEPNVYFDNDVAIKVALEVSNLAREIRTSSGTLAYQIGTRSASTTLRLRDGETQLLAGLLSNADRSDGARLPGAGDLPFMSRIFGTQRDSSERTEIVLSITPRLIRPARMPDASLNEFWSGTETSLRLRPLTLASVEGPGAVGNAQAAAALPGQSGGPWTQASTQPSQATEGPAAKSGATNRPPTRASAAIEGPARIKAGEVATFSVRLKADGGIRSLPMQLEFDQQRFQLVEITEGAFFKQAGGSTLFSRQVQPGEGRVMVMAQRTGGDGAFGDDVVLTLQLKALGPGAGRLRMVSANPVGVEGVVPALESLPSLEIIVD